VVAQSRVVLTLDAEPDETEEQLAPLTRELELDLREVGEVEFVTAEPQPHSKGAGDIVLAALAIVTEPTYVQALIETVVAFLRRNDGRSARLTVGDIELSIDGPTGDQVDALIEMTRTALDRDAARRSER
jgi:hypothetical protein